MKQKLFSIFFALALLLTANVSVYATYWQEDCSDMVKVFLNYNGNNQYRIGINGYDVDNTGLYTLWIIPSVTINTTDAYCSDGQYVLNGTYNFSSTVNNTNTTLAYWCGNFLTWMTNGKITFTYLGNSRYNVSVTCSARLYSNSYSYSTEQVGWSTNNVYVELDANGPLNHPVQPANISDVDITILSPTLQAVSQQGGNRLKLSALYQSGGNIMNNPVDAAYLDFIVNNAAYNAKYIPTGTYPIGTSGTPRIERGDELCRSNDFGFNKVWRFIPVTACLVKYHTEYENDPDYGWDYFDYSDLGFLYSGNVYAINPNHDEYPMYVQVDAQNSESSSVTGKLYASTPPEKRSLTASAGTGGNGTPTISCAEGHGYANSAALDFTSGGNYYYVGTHITLTAPAASYGYVFSKWQKDGADFSGNTSTDVSFDVSSNATYTAIYNPAPSYTVTLGSPTGGTFSGSITELSTTIVSGSSYYSGAHLVFDATADVANGYQLKQWNVTNGGSTTTYTSNPLNLTLTSNITVTPIFVQQTQITTDYAYVVRSSYSGSSTINIRGRNNDYEVSVGLTATSLTQTGSVTFRSDATNSYILDLATGTKTTFSSGDNLTITRTGTSDDYTYTLTGTLNGGEYRVTMAYKDPSGALNEYGSASTFNPTFTNITIGGSGTTRTITASSGSSNSQKRISVELYVPSGTGNQVIPTGIYYVQSGSSANTIKQSRGRSGSKNNYTYNTSWCRYSSSGNNYIYFRRGIMEIINVGNKTTPDYIRSDVQNSSGYPITFTYGTKPDLRTVNISAENGTVGLSANTDPVGGKYYNGTTITLTPDEADGYVFDSWSGGSPTDNGDGTYTITLSGDVNLTANFIESYTVSFDAGEGTGSMSDQEVGVGKTVNLTANEFTGPSITVYYEYNDATGGNSKASETVNSIFLGWDGSDGEFYEDEAEITDITSAGETFTMTAQWSFNNITLPTPTKTGYTFLAWEGTFGGMDLSEDAGAEVSVEEGGTFTAQWEINKYTVTIAKNNNGYGTLTEESDNVRVINNVPYGTVITTGTGENANKVTINGNTVTATPASDAAGYTYTFQNWTNGTATVVGTTTVTANFTRSLIPYTITYNLNDGTNPVSPAPATSYNVETADITLPTPTKEGYNFLGWYANSDLTTGGVVTTIPVGSYGDKVFWAKWEKKTYTITYNAGANGTGTIDAGEKTYNEDFTLSNSTFTRTGYTQTGWSTTDGGAKAYDLGETYTGNTALNLYPYWEINTYDITFKNADGSTLKKSDETTDAVYSVAYGETPVYDGATPTKAADDAYTYTFNGWDNEIVAVTEDATYTATYSTTKVQYTLAWDVNDGNALTGTYTNGTIDWGTDIVKPANPTRTDYTFGGWDANNDGTADEVAATMPTNDITYKALWTAASPNITLCENCDNDHYNTFKSDYDRKTVNVTYPRQFAANRWSTMCLPFSIELPEMITQKMYGRVYEFKYATGNANTNSGVNLYFSNAKKIEAGTCYIVNANDALAAKTSFVFSGVTIDLTNDKGAALTSVGAYNNLPGYKSEGTIELVGTLRNGTLHGMSTGNTYMGLKDNKIYYPNISQGSTIWAYRGIFRSTSALNVEKMRIIVDGEDRGEIIIDADGEILDASGNAESRKFIENGILYIEREGVIYDAQGKRVESSF